MGEAVSCYRHDHADIVRYFLSNIDWPFYNQGHYTRFPFLDFVRTSANDGDVGFEASWDYPREHNDPGWATDSCYCLTLVWLLCLLSLY